MPRPPGVRHEKIRVKFAWENQHITSLLAAPPLKSQWVVGVRYARISLALLTHIALASEHANPRLRVRFIGSGNVVNRRPLCASF